MIRINLLPVRQIKKKQLALSNIIRLGITLLGVLVILGLFALFLGVKVGDLQASIKKLNAEKKKYQTTINQIEKLKKDQALLETKLNIISKMKRGSQLTVRLLDEMASLVPSSRLWVNKMSIKGAVLRLSGTALDNATIADFMETVVASPYFATAELSGTSNKGVSGRTLKVFSLTCKVVNPAIKEEEMPEEEPKGKKKKK
jgi:type IV pilus assembly protein PilN